MAAMTTVLNVGMAPCLAMGMTYVQGAQSISLLMENAVLNEKLAQITGRASTDQCVALILDAGAIGIKKGK